MIKKQSIAQTHECPVCNWRHGRGLSVDALVIRENSILLVKRGHDPYKGMWALPGGMLDEHETVEQAVLRELKEETSLEADIETLLGVFSSPSRHPRQAIALAYIISNIQGEPTAGDDAVDISWFNLNDLPLLAFDHAEMIDRYKKYVLTLKQ